jgi:hypothetical protein
MKYLFLKPLQVHNIHLFNIYITRTLQGMHLFPPLYGFFVNHLQFKGSSHDSIRVFLIKVC